MQGSEPQSLIPLGIWGSKGQIKPKAVWERRRFSQKRMNGFIFFAVKSKKSKQNKFVSSFTA